MAAQMARGIRAVTKYDAQETFDLAGFNHDQIVEMVPLAFQEPFTLALRICFVVGGGRLVRAKYHEDLQKWLSAALRELGFEEDRGAALGSQGVYKRQEDLAQNLVFYHVFPNFVKPVEESGGGGGGEGDGAPAPPTPAQRVVSCTLDELKRMAPTKIMTFSEKRRVQELLQGAIKRIDDLEAKMAGRAQLSEAEVAEYGELNREALEEKLKWCQGECKAQVAAGLLTVAEYGVIVKEMGGKLGAMKEEAGKLPAGDKRGEAAAARIAELTAKWEKAQADSVRAVLPPLRGAEDIRKMKSALERLRRIEKDKNGKLLTVAEARELSNIPDLEERITAAVQEARGFFETDEEFNIRLQHSIAAAPPRRR